MISGRLESLTIDGVECVGVTASRVFSWWKPWTWFSRASWEVSYTFRPESGSVAQSDRQRSLEFTLHYDPDPNDLDPEVVRAFLELEK